MCFHKLFYNSIQYGMLSYVKIKTYEIFATWRIKMNKYPLTENDKELIKEALKVLEKNFDDGIYNHAVGAAVICKNGKVYSGVNCDGVHGSCAEYITMGTAISAGEKEFDTIVAVKLDTENNLVAPCGNCRQMMMNYCPDIKVILNDENKNAVKVDIIDLLPLAWKPTIY